MRLIRKADFARERGVHPSRVSQWLRDGRLVEAEHGRIDADVGHTTLDAHLDQAKGARRNGNVTSSALANTAPGAVLSAGRAIGVDGLKGPREPKPEMNERPNDGSAAQADETRVEETRGDGSRIGEPAKPGTRDESGYWEHKARREKAEAQLAEMKALQAAGALVLAAPVAKEARETARKLRNMLQAMADQLAPVLDPASPSRAHKLLTDYTQKVIREFCDGLDERAARAAATAESDATVV